MDVKKSPKASLEDKKFIYLLMGFILALSLVYIGFEWTDPKITVHKAGDADMFFEEELDIIQTSQETPPPPPPPPVEQIPEVLTVVDDNQEVETINVDTEDNQNQAVEVRVPVAPPVVIEEEENVIFQVVEKMPEFPGGQEALFKYLSSSIRYPAIAQENGIQGRVICQFVVNKDGSIVDVVVVKSIDPSLDKEAIRVIQAMPKWNAGQQRGKSVRVKYTLPVNFKLQ